MDAEVEQIKNDSFADIKTRRVIMLVEADYGFDVRQWSPDGVAPTSSYDSAQEAAARALQLLGLKEPISPQDWPETVGIGDAGAPPKPKPQII